MCNNFEVNYYTYSLRVNLYKISEIATQNLALTIKVGSCIEDRETGGTRLVSFIAWLKREGGKEYTVDKQMPKARMFSSCSGRLTLLQLQSVKLTI